MRAYLSHSTAKEEIYVLSAISQELREQGIFAVVGENQNYPFQSAETVNLEIAKSDLLIAIITNKIWNYKQVNDDIRIATIHKIPVIVLVEKGIKINLKEGIHSIAFERSNPRQAIEKIHQRIADAKKGDKVSNTIAWLVGGAALIAAISILSKKD